MEQGPITLNFTNSNNPFPKGEIIITEKLGTACVKPRRELKDLKVDDKIDESLKDQINKYIEVQPKVSTTIKGKYVRKVGTVDVLDRHTQFPFSAICSLDIFFDNSIYHRGTGFMIGSRHILTAAHNIYQEKYGGAAKDIYVSPGKRRTLTPFGVYKVTHAYLLTSSSKGSYNDDIAILALNFEIGDYTGWFGMVDLNYEDLKGEVQNQPDNFTWGKRLAQVCGYDYPESNQTKLVLQSLKIDSGELFDKSLLGTSLYKDELFYYDIDTVKGQSGSPVWVLSGQNCYAVGVHKNFNHSPEGQKSNVGARLTKEKIIKICDLIGKQNISVSNPFNEKAPQDLEEVLESFKKCKNEEEKNRLIGFLSSYKHYRLIDPVQMRKKMPEQIPQNIPNKIPEKLPKKIIRISDCIPVYGKIKDFEVTCQIFRIDKAIQFGLQKTNFMKSIKALKNQEYIDSLSLDFRNCIEHKQFEVILKMLPKILKLYHLEIKINISNTLDIANLMSKVPKSHYFDLYIRQAFDDRSIQKCRDIFNSILDKNPDINLYLEFEFDKFDIKQIDYTMLKISSSWDSKKDIYPLKSGFCILANDPRHEVTYYNIEELKMKKSIFRCLKSFVESSAYEDKKFKELLRDVMIGKRFIKYGGTWSYSEGFNDDYIANSVFKILSEQDGLDDLIEISLALNEKVFDTIDQKNAKVLLKKIQSINFTFEKTESDNNTISKLCELIFDCQNLKHLQLNFSGCKKITDAGLKALSSILKNLKSNLLKFSVDFTSCKSISDAGIKELSQSIQNLINISSLTLDFSHCSTISDAGMKVLSQSIQHLSSLSYLTLDFSNCSKISDAGMKVVSQSIQHLSNISNLTLNFSSCSNISHAGLKVVSQSIQHLSNITSFELNGGLIE